MLLCPIIEAGQLWTEQKDELPHDQFTKWIEDRLPFTPRTARNYVNLYKKRDLLKTETISDLSGAYKLLKGFQEKPESKLIEEIHSLHEGLLRTFDNDEAVSRFTDSLIEIIDRNKKEFQE